MRRTPNKKRIGLFVIIGLLMFMSVIGKFLSDKIFTNEEDLVVMYFSESVKGLNVGSPVVFKGVQIGKVSKIELIAGLSDLEFSIPVYAKLDATQDLKVTSREYYYKQTVLDAFIKRGLRARLITQSYLTGQLMIELEMLPDTPVRLKNNPRDKDVLEIPTVLSPLGELSRGIQNLPIRETVVRLNAILDELESQLPRILPQWVEISETLNQIVTQNGPQTAETLNNLNRTLYDVSDAAKSLRNFADYIERHPEALLKGKGGY